MKDFREIAKKYIELGLWVIPVNSQKSPAIKNWFDLQTRPMNNQEIEIGFKKCFGIALLCGGTPNVELLDWDLKYDLSGDLYDRVKSKIPKSIKAKMFVQSTMNDGYHWIYKIPKDSTHPNQKLANRHTTSFEKHQVYTELFKVPKTRDNAMKIAINDTHRVLIETRGGTVDRCGGYGLISPTPGYEKIYSPEGGLQELTFEEHALLLEIVREFNEVRELGTVNTSQYDSTVWKVTPFEDYNERGDVVSLLIECGWEEIRSTGNNVRLKRPGATSGSSGLFDADRGIFSCFSTSTRFDTNKSYNSSGVFIELEADGDTSEAYNKLVDLGFGIKE